MTRTCIIVQHCSAVEHEVVQCICLRVSTADNPDAAHNTELNMAKATCDDDGLAKQKHPAAGGHVQAEVCIESFAQAATGSDKRVQRSHL